MVNATALVMVCALCGAAGKGSDSRRALDEPNAVQMRPVVLVVPDTVVVTREDDIVIESLESAVTVNPLSDEWSGRSPASRVRASWMHRVVRVVEAM